MSTEADKEMMATGGIEEEDEIDTLTEEEATWIKALREYRLMPGFKPDELDTFLRTFNKKEKEKMVKKEPSLVTFGTGLVKESKTSAATGSTTTTSTGSTTGIPHVTPTLSTGSLHNYPKLSVFSGDDNKGEASWEAFKFEVDSLIGEHLFLEEQILLGIRRALKGTASDIVRRLGTGITVRECMTKLNSTYGSIESSESVMRKFYSSTQGTDSVSAYAVRLEDLYSQAVELGAITKNETLLKQMLYQGLRLDLKHVAQYKFDKISDYDRFKMELRVLEAEMKQPEIKTKTCHATQKVEGKEKSDLNRLEDTVKQLQEKIEQIELNKKNHTYNMDSQRYRRGYGRSRGYNPRGYRGRGRGVYEPSRPLATNTFRGACHRCGERGHFIRDCPTGYSNSSLVCYRCGEKGHFARDCQVDYKDIQKKKDLKE